MKNFLFTMTIAACSFGSISASQQQEIPQIWQAVHADNWSLTHKLYLSADLSSFDEEMSKRLALIYYFYKQEDFISMYSMIDSLGEHCLSESKQ